MNRCRLYKCEEALLQDIYISNHRLQERTKVDTVDFNELFNLLQNSDETDRIEAKSAAGGIGKSFLETVSAFSNEPDLGGGYILLGVTKNEDDKGSKYVITGVPDPDRLQQNIASQCRELFSTPL
jgi:ATP-dependent DNA helicase RecG